MIPWICILTLLGQPIYELEEIVVTATRYPAALKDIALATIVIERQEIDKINPLNLGEVLQAYAGVDIKDYGTPGTVKSIFIRGIPANGTLILLNGHPLNSVTIGMADINAINVNTVERVEIIKGPVSNLYGANALGGVVNIITTKDIDKTNLAFKITPSTSNLDTPWQTKEVCLNAALPFKNAGIDIAGAYTASDGYRNNSDLTGHHFRGALNYKNKRFQTVTAFTYDNKEYGVPGPKPLVDSVHPVPMFGDSTVTSLLDREQDRIMIGDVNVKLDLTEDIKWHNTIFADRKLTHFKTTYLDFGTGDTITKQFDYLVHTIGLNTILITDFDKTEIVFGIDGHYDTLETTEKIVQNGDTVWHASSYNVGGWLEVKQNFNKVKFIPGIRFDRNSDFGNFLSPSIGIASPLLTDLWMKVSIGKAFRAPTFNDLFWPISGNPDLKPEHGWAYEVRFESAPIPNLLASLSLFMRNVKDRIFWLPNKSGLWQPQNVNYLSIKGIDVELHGQVSEITDFYLEGTYLKSTQKNDEIVYVDTGGNIMEEIEREAAFTPKYTISSKVSFKLPHEFTINASGSFVAERMNYYPNYDNYPDVSMDKKILDAYFILNTSLTKKLFNYVTLAIGAKNLLDTKYATQFGSTIDDFDYPMPGRIVFVRLTMNY
jgi:vitamin B12 transporter